MNLPSSQKVSTLCHDDLMVCSALLRGFHSREFPHQQMEECIASTHLLSTNTSIVSAAQALTGAPPTNRWECRLRAHPSSQCQYGGKKKSCKLHITANPVFESVTASAWAPTRPCPPPRISPHPQSLVMGQLSLRGRSETYRGMAWLEPKLRLLHFHTGFAVMCVLQDFFSPYFQTLSVVLFKHI